MQSTTVHAHIAAQAKNNPDAPAILSIDLEPISHRKLFRQISHTIKELNRLGIGRGDRVAIVMPNGPEMAVIFLSVSSCATSAPLNPNYRITEYDFYLTDLKARALLIPEGMDSPAIDAALQHNIPVIRLIPEKSGADKLFKLSGEIIGQCSNPGPSNPDDIALVLHTSGTTSRPKLVPLTQENLYSSARHIVKTLQLTRDDRCLNIMPLFHIHGLMAPLLASLLSGGSVVCTPGFHAPYFYSWMEQFQPTWYSAVPSMHQSILERAPAHQDTLARIHLRFLRSSSAPLPPQVMADLEQVFQSPVIEAYGMTEATHQIASNPLPPLPRKSGSVGLPAGPDLAIMSEDGSNLLPPGQTGEIVLRGKNIMPGYLNNPEANRKAFTDGWFRTGDLGSIDPDGYVIIQGRLKEIINRGGEKISPREIDEVLLQHPAVSQAMAFGFPDPRLGEDIAAAVVLREPGITDKELRRFVAEHLTVHKVPKYIFLLDELPKGATGKPQRIGLAHKLGLDAGSVEVPTETGLFTAPQTTTEKKIASLWCEVLNLDQVSTTCRFLELGGDSMTAMQLVNRICEWVGGTISLVDFFEAQTIREQAIITDQIISRKNSVPGNVRKRAESPERK